jgi:hypothetical protein
MTFNRRRAALSAVIIAAIIGWAGAGVASAGNAVPDSNNGESVSDSNKWDLVSFSNKWD